MCSSGLFDSLGNANSCTYRVLPIITLEKDIRGKKAQDGSWNLYV